MGRISGVGYVPDATLTLKCARENINDLTVGIETIGDGAIQSIRRDFAAALPVEALAEKALMSVSAFHRHFKAVTAMSPLQYQKRIRLLQARKLLTVGGKSVTAAAFEVGYESPTQFSREYARAFGLSPARDSARIVAGMRRGADLQH